MATNTKTNNLTLLDNINSFVDFMDCSIPPTSDGTSYSDGTYDIEWNSNCQAGSFDFWSDNGQILAFSDAF